jgi:uncharacterized protein (DUF885 family)
LVERYWDENAALVPWFTWGGADLHMGATPGGAIAPQKLADALAMERRYFAEISAVPRPELDTDARLTYDLFRRQRLESIEGFTYPFELLPVNPYEGMPQRFASMAMAAERLALSSSREFDGWRTRIESFPIWTNQAIANMRDGMRRGYTLPRPLVEKTLPLLAALGEDAPGNPFYRAMQSSSGPADSAGLAPQMTAVIRDKILPPYRALHAFLLTQYLPRARKSAALSALPLGDAWYAYLSRRATGGPTSPAELHALGTAEMEHLRQRMQVLLAETPFAGNAQGFGDHVRRDARPLDGNGADGSSPFAQLKTRVAEAAPTLFAALPRADFGIRPVDPYQEPVAAPLSYRPRAPNGLLAAELLVNAAHLDADFTAQFLREAVPGHHYQLELERERADLPRFRRFGDQPAFVEGWGLYAATLGEELGLFHDAESKFGVLLAETECAAGLVIDTGIHAQGMSRQQALAYLRSQVPVDPAAAEQIVDRIIALPGEALACTVGLLKIEGLRTLAQQTLGARFDLRAFHSQVIKDGAMPLDLLEAKVKHWMAEVAANAAGPVAETRDASDAPSVASTPKME